MLDRRLSEPRFPIRGGEMGERMRALDWSRSPLGDPAGWPAALRTSVAIMLDASFPMFVVWGQARGLLYNDAYGSLLGTKHPSALGQPFHEVWAEIWDELAPLVERTIVHGEAHMMDDIPLMMQRHGHVEETWFTYFYTPVRLDDGSVPGMLCGCVETTSRMIAERERTKAEQALKQHNTVLLAENVERIRERDRMWNVTRDPLAISDKEGRLVAVNPAWTTLLGWFEDELLGRTSEWLEHPADRARSRAEIASLGMGRPSYAFEHRLRAKDGSYRSLSWACVPEGDLIFCSSRDMTTERRAEERQALLYKLLLQQRAASDEGAIMRAAAATLGRYLGVDRTGFFEMRGADTAVFVENWSNGAVPPLEGEFPVAGLGAVLDAVRLGETLVSADTRSDPHMAGSIFPAIGTLSAIGVPLVRDGRWYAGLYVNHGEVRHWRGDEVTLVREIAELTWDAVERLRAQASVLERTRERDRIWLLSRDLLGIANSSGIWLSVNPAWQHILGWSPADIVGKTSEWLEHPDDREKTRAEVRNLADGIATMAFENRFRTVDGSYRTLSWTAVPEGELLYCIARDITAERQRQAELDQAQEALRQSQKTEAIGQLVGGVAHDFNNLLTIIRSSVDLLRRPTLAEERRHRYLEAVSDTVDRAAKLTSQLLAFARRQALKPEVFDARAKLHGIGDMLDSVTGARIRVSIEVPEHPCFIRADVSQFETALVNMAVNARDAMNGEGELVLRLKRGVTMPPIRGHAASRATFTTIAVSDTGSGIAAEQLSHIFDPFWTTKGVGKGTGLGLSQVFGFAKQSGGDVDVESIVGEGTTFTLYLPGEQAPAQATPDGADPADLVVGGGQRVLVVEDNVEVGRFATQIVEDLGYRPEWVTNAEEALERLGGDGGGIDVVFSDVVMPGMGGVALAEHLRSQLPALPVVLASGYSHILAQETGHGFELLHKPYSADQLARVFQKVIARSVEAMRDC